VSQREYYTTSEFARIWGLSRATVARLADRGRIPVRRAGIHRRIFKADLEAAGLTTGDAPVATRERPRRADVLAAGAQIRGLARRHGARDLRLFGSIAADRADEVSDIDLLAQFEPRRSLLDLVALEADLTALLGRRVHVTSVGSVPPAKLQRIESQAIPV
jgi:excisionase family DNA binding protein